MHHLGRYSHGNDQRLSVHWSIFCWYIPYSWGIHIICKHTSYLHLPAVRYLPFASALSLSPLRRARDWKERVLQLVNKPYLQTKNSRVLIIPVDHVAKLAYLCFLEHRDCTPFACERRPRRSPETRLDWLSIWRWGKMGCCDIICW